MKIKHLLLLFTIPLVLFSCSKDKDESSPSIVGKWEFVSNTYQYYDAKGVELKDKKEVYDYKDYVKKPYFDFKSDGTGMFFDFDGPGGKPFDPEKFTYTIKGDKVTITRDTEDGEKEVNEMSFTIKNDILTLVGVDEEFDEGIKEVTTSVTKRLK